MREFELIDSIRSANGVLDPSVVVPPGDDLGLIRLPGGQGLLAGVDQVVSGVHLAEDAPPETYGAKVMNRSLSDVAAMACVPVGALVSATLPPRLMDDPHWSIRFAEAARAAGGLFGAPLFGGDVAVHVDGNGPFTASATVLAIPDPDPRAKGRVVLRSGARPGDTVWVSGAFGGSLEEDGGGHHASFLPRIELALELHRLMGTALSSMIDVSDGLAADAGHLAHESGCGIELEAERVPRRGNASLDGALADGEDYELCFTIGPGASPPDRLADVPLVQIGRVIDGSGVAIHEGGRPYRLSRPGWEHHR